MTLDCSSVDSALGSLSELFGMEQIALRERLLATELDWYSDVAPEDQLVTAFGFESRVRMPSPDAVKWFHATRVPKGTTFTNGILPTEAALSEIWRSLEPFALDLISAEKWQGFRLNAANLPGQFSDQLDRKHMDKKAWQGPFAFLVREAAIGKVGDHQHFFSLPETIKDICATFERHHGGDLLKRFRAGTFPCLVVFTRPGDSHNAVSGALNYVHRSLWNLGHGLECNANFAAQNTAVPPGWINEIQWLSDEELKHLHVAADQSSV